MIQGLLPITDHGRDALASKRVRIACSVVAKKYGYKAIAKAWACDEDTVGQKIDEKNRNSIKPNEMLALKRLDTDKIIATAEEAELSSDTSDEKVVQRLPGVLRKYVTDILAELIESDLGMR